MFPLRSVPLLTSRGSLGRKNKGTLPFIAINVPFYYIRFLPLVNVQNSIPATHVPASAPISEQGMA